MYSDSLLDVYAELRTGGRLTPYETELDLLRHYVRSPTLLRSTYPGRSKSFYSNVESLYKCLIAEDRKAAKHFATKLDQDYNHPEGFVGNPVWAYILDGIR